MITVLWLTVLCLGCSSTEEPAAVAATKPVKANTGEPGAAPTTGQLQINPNYKTGK